MVTSISLGKNPVSRYIHSSHLINENNKTSYRELYLKLTPRSWKGQVQTQTIVLAMTVCLLGPWLIVAAYKKMPHIVYTSST